MIHAAFYNRYIEQIDLSTPLSTQLEETWDELNTTLSNRPDSWWVKAYEIGKWTPLELMVHLIDVERVYQYRAHCIAAGEQSELPGFNENEYVSRSQANTMQWKQLVDELYHLRKATQIMFSRFDGGTLSTTGRADGESVDVEAIGFIMAAHLHHHTRILKTRYL